MAVSPGYLSSIRDRVPQSQRAPKSPYVQSLSETVFAADMDLHDQTNMADGDMQKKKKPAAPPPVNDDAKQNFLRSLSNAGIQANQPQEITPGYGPGTPWLTAKKPTDVAGPSASAQPAPTFDPNKLPGGPETKPLNRAHVDEAGIQLDNPAYPAPREHKISAADEARGAMHEAGIAVNNPDFLPPKPEADQPVGASQQDHGGQSQPQYGGLGQYQEAHEVSAVNPDRADALNQGFADEARARLDEGNVMANAQDVAGQGQEDAARQEMADLDQINANQKARQEYLDRVSADVEKDSQDMASAKVDPERFWHNKSTGSKLLTLLGLFAGGFVAAQKGGPNHAADTLQSMIQNDISSQREAIENKWGALRTKHSLLRDSAERYGNMDVAEKAAVAARLQGAALMVQGMVARATSPAEKLRAQELAAQLEQKAAEAGIAANRWIQAGYVGGGAGQGGFTHDIKGSQIVRLADGTEVAASDDQQAKEYNAANSATEIVRNQAKELQALMMDKETYNPMSSKRGEFEPLKKALSMADLKEATGGNAGRAFGLMKYLSEAVGDSASLNPITRRKSFEAVNKFVQKLDEDAAYRDQQLHGNPTIQRVVDPARQTSKIRITGTYGGSKQSASTSLSTFKPAGK